MKLNSKSGFTLWLIRHSNRSVCNSVWKRWHIKDDQHHRDNGKSVNTFAYNFWTYTRWRSFASISLYSRRALVMLFTTFVRIAENELETLLFLSVCYSIHFAKFTSSCAMKLLSSSKCVESMSLVYNMLSFIRWLCAKEPIFLMPLLANADFLFQQCVCVRALCAVMAFFVRLWHIYGMHVSRFEHVCPFTSANNVFIWCINRNKSIMNFVIGEALVCYTVLTCGTICVCVCVCV